MLRTFWVQFVLAANMADSLYRGNKESAPKHALLEGHHPQNA